MNRTGDRDKPDTRVCRGAALEGGEASLLPGSGGGDRGTVAPVYGGNDQSGGGFSNLFLGHNNFQKTCNFRQ